MVLLVLAIIGLFVFIFFGMRLAVAFDNDVSGCRSNCRGGGNVTQTVNFPPSFSTEKCKYNSEHDVESEKWKSEFEKFKAKMKSATDKMSVLDD